MSKCLLWAAAVLFAGAAAAPAPASEAPWCAVVDLGFAGVYWDCQYHTLKQCIPVVIAGNRGFCNPNPAYTGPNPSSKRTIHHRRRNRR